MRKLIICFALSLCSVLCSVSAYAAMDITGWEKSFCQIPAGKEGAVEFLQEGEDPAPEGGLGMLHLWCGGPTGTANLSANAVQAVSGLDKTKKYRLTGDVKFTTNDTKLYLTNVSINGTMTTSIDLQGHFGAVNNGKWVELSLDITPTNPTVEFRFAALANRALWIDNISFKEIIYDEDGVTETGLGEELIVNGDFEADLDFEAPADVTDITVYNMDSASKITWTNPEEDFEVAYVYREGESEPVGFTADGYIVVDGLENEVEYTYIIKSADKVKNFSDGVSVTVKPVPDDFKAGEVKFEVNGAEVDELSAGRLKTSVDLKNNGMEEDFSAELIVVLLKDGALVDINTSYSVIPKTDWRDDYTTLETDITIPSGDGYSVEVYIWSSLGDMETVVNRRISL